MAKNITSKGMDLINELLMDLTTELANVAIDNAYGKSKLKVTDVKKAVDVILKGKVKRLATAEGARVVTLYSNGLFEFEYKPKMTIVQEIKERPSAEDLVASKVQKKSRKIAKPRKENFREIGDISMGDFETTDIPKKSRKTAKPKKKKPLKTESEGDFESESEILETELEEEEPVTTEMEVKPRTVKKSKKGKRLVEDFKAREVQEKSRKGAKPKKKKILETESEEDLESESEDLESESEEEEPATPKKVVKSRKIKKSKKGKKLATDLKPKEVKEKSRKGAKPKKKEISEIEDSSMEDLETTEIQKKSRKTVKPKKKKPLKTEYSSEKDLETEEEIESDLEAEPVTPEIEVISSKAKKSKKGKKPTALADEFRTGVCDLMYMIYPEGSLPTESVMVLCAMLQHIAEEIVDIVDEYGGNRIRANDIRSATKELLPARLSKHAIAEGARMVFLRGTGMI